MIFGTQTEKGIGVISADWSVNLHADMAMAMAVFSCSPVMRPVVRCSNAASMNGGAGGQASGGPQSVGVLIAEPPLQSSPMHSVTVVDRQRGITHQFSVPEDQYILHTGEDQNISLPFSCRHGCCTACAVRVKSGQLHQPEALGISAELKAQGYGLLCVGYALSDLEVETQDEDEVYWLQFGQFFARGPIENDNYALELAMADE